MEYYIYKGEDELYHYGVKGMRWGVRKSRSSYDRNTNRTIRKLNRVNTKMEKHRTIQSELSKIVENGRKSRNPFIKLYAAYHIPDQKIAASRYSKAKKKVDAILNDLDQRGVTLKKLTEQKGGFSAGAGYNYLTRWTGDRYEQG